MRLEKRIAIGITKEERNALREITNIVEDIFNKEIEEYPEIFAQIVSGIYGGYKVIHTEMGSIEIEYDT